MRIAPDTHLALTLAGVLASALAASAAPEERWYRTRVHGACTELWLPIGANPELAHDAGDAQSMIGW